MLKNICSIRLIAVIQFSNLISSSLLLMTCHIIHRWSLQWRHNERDGVSNHQPHDCLLNRLFNIKENIKAMRHWPLCGNSPVTGEFPAQTASYAENVCIWWRHHVTSWHRDNFRMNGPLWGEPPGNGGFPSHICESFDIFFDFSLNKLLKK